MSSADAAPGRDSSGPPPRGLAGVESRSPLLRAGRLRAGHTGRHGWCVGGGPTGRPIAKWPDRVRIVAGKPLPSHRIPPVHYRRGRCGATANRGATPAHQAAGLPLSRSLADTLSTRQQVRVSTRLQTPGPRLERAGGLDGFGTVLKTMRETAGLSPAALAARSVVSKSHLGHLETGERVPTADIAAVLDTTLRAGGVLMELAALERGGGDDMRRRALLATVGAAASLGAIGGPHALGDMVRHGLLDAAGTEEDWDEVLATNTRLLVTDPSPLLGASLLTNLMVIKQQMRANPARGLFRSAAGLGIIYGLWLGNHDQLGGAGHWYRTSATLADRSGDTDMMAWVRGRAASRGVYEDWTVDHALNVATTALAVTDRPTLGALEAHAAQVGAYALTGDARRGRAAVEAMADVAEQLPAPSAGPGPVERTVFLSAFLEARVGTPDSAEAAYERAESALAGLPTWLLESRVYRARAMVADGDIAGGLAYALQAVDGLRHDVRVISVAVRDVCQAVPASYRGDDLHELHRHASPIPGPWERLR
ncbi:helix-turn-helix domain-containing protein [Micromonospora sp. NBC_01796]|uniref:helix-turn-helix domain-containing protein n=1 Tax=Micromonospora sp. NBC_01796 TaxID=2975987 RepID=UPI002DD990F6|nr:helix-turn-helix transcriptional regulator [Micromonospora sp. NBC_01796]WSA84485.1 helix-turn-helix domain-containing protein [Micromonospora sp. NBC_01796]